KFALESRECLKQVRVVGLSVYHPSPEQIRRDLSSGNAPDYTCSSDLWLENGEDQVAPNGPAHLERYEFNTVLPGLRRDDVIVLGPTVDMRRTAAEIERLRREAEEKERQERERLHREVIGPLRDFFNAHPRSRLCEVQVAPLLSEFTPLYSALCVCLSDGSLAGQDAKDALATRQVKEKADEMHSLLQFRIREEADMREIITQLLALDAVTEDSQDIVEDTISDLEKKIRRCKRRGKSYSRYEADRVKQQAELDRMEEIVTQGRILVQRLIRHQSHPEAKKVLASNPVQHPLDDTRLAPFVKSCLNISLQTLCPQPFMTVGKTTLLQGVHPESKVKVVLKGYHLDDSAEVEHARREVSVFESVQDVNIVPYLGLVVDSDKCYVVTKQYDCNLMEYLQHHRPSLDTKRFIGRETLRGMAALESHRVVHRDIKPQNILVNHTNGKVTSVVLTDFGISKNNQDYVTTLNRTTSGTMLFIDHESIMSKSFDSLSDIYSYGRTMQVLFNDSPADMLWLHTAETFASTELSTMDVKFVNTCLGPKKDRWSAQLMASHGLFAMSVGNAPGVVADNALARMHKMVAQNWKQAQPLKASAKTVHCKADSLRESLLSHFAPPEDPSLSGYCLLAVDQADGDEESPLRAVLSALQRPVTINGESVRLLEPAGEGEYQLVPSLHACTLMQECVGDEGVDTRQALAGYYAALGRFLAFQLLDGPLPHGLLGMAVLGALRGDIDGLLQEEGAVSRVFAATFPQQRHTLLNLLAKCGPVPFSIIPGSPESEEVLSRHNQAAFSSVFESSYVGLMMEAGREIHRGFCSLDPDWAEVTAALSLDQFLDKAVSMSAFTVQQYTATFAIESDTLRDAFRDFVDRQISLHSNNLLRLVLMFATGSPMLPHSKITLEMAVNADRLALPSAHQCSATITVPDSCLARLDIAFQDSCDASRISLGTGGRSREAALSELNNELNRFRKLSETRRTCPSCGVAVEKDGGCNRISCHCGRHWCWECGYVADGEAAVYSHLIEAHKGY
ncbi:hypothetical protein KIPB_009398, partial [Kipferlia bialata]